MKHLWIRLAKPQARRFTCHPCGSYGLSGAVRRFVYAVQRKACNGTAELTVTIRTNLQRSCCTYSRPWAVERRDSTIQPLLQRRTNAMWGFSEKKECWREVSVENPGLKKFARPASWFRWPGRAVWPSGKASWYRSGTCRSSERGSSSPASRAACPALPRLPRHRKLDLCIRRAPPRSVPSPD